MAATIDGYKDNKFPIKKFLFLYRIYKYNIRAICNTFEHEYIQTDIIGSSDKLKQYLVHNFGLYFPIHNLNGTILNTNRIYYEQDKVSLKTFPILNIKYTDDKEVELLLEENYVDPISTINEMEYHKVKYHGMDVKSISLHASNAISVMIYMEQVLADMIYSNIEDFIRLLQTGNEFYPLPEIWGNFRVCNTSMKFTTISNNKRCYTAMSVWVPKTDILCKVYYICFDYITKVLMNHIHSITLTGKESIKYNISSNNIWTEKSLKRSMSTVGSYLPIILNVSPVDSMDTDRMIVKDGRNRYHTLKILDMEDKSCKALGLILCCHNEIFKDPVNIYMPLELYTNCTWNMPKQNKITPPINIDTINTVNIEVLDLYSLIHYFYLLYREIHNFIDDGYMEMYQIEPLNFVLPTTEGE